LKRLLQATNKLDNSADLGLNKYIKFNLVQKMGCDNFSIFVLESGKEFGFGRHFAEDTYTSQGTSFFDSPFLFESDWEEHKINRVHIAGHIDRMVGSSNWQVFESMLADVIKHLPNVTTIQFNMPMYTEWSTRYIRCLHPFLQTDYATSVRVRTWPEDEFEITSASRAIPLTFKFVPCNMYESGMPETYRYYFPNRLHQELLTYSAITSFRKGCMLQEEDNVEANCSCTTLKELHFTDGGQPWLTPAHVTILTRALTKPADISANERKRKRNREGSLCQLQSLTLNVRLKAQDFERICQALITFPELRELRIRVPADTIPLNVSDGAVIDWKIILRSWEPFLELLQKNTGIVHLEALPIGCNSKSCKTGVSAHLKASIDNILRNYNRSTANLKVWFWAKNPAEIQESLDVNHYGFGHLLDGSSVSKPIFEKILLGAAERDKDGRNYENSLFLTLRVSPMLVNYFIS